MAADLELHYRVAGDIERVIVPERRTPRRADKLWQHTCFEAFVRDVRAPGYVELNFSPSGEWAAYRFTGYRAGMQEADTATPRVAIHREVDMLEMDVSIDLDSLQDLSRAVELQLALSAVIEERQRGLSYWALAHPDARPDFHHAGGFTLRIDS